jgi:hypothetical protein
MEVMATRPTCVVPRPPDALVVPTIRPVDQLRLAIDLAEALGCPVVALRSRQPALSDPMVVDAQVPVWMLDLVEGATHGLPPFEAEALLRTTPFHLRSDLSLKRNLALLLAKLAGWSRIFLLDDDITVDDPHDVRRAVGLLDTYPAAGLVVEGFPDGSVLSHAEFVLGATASKTVSGGALALAVADPPSFFPRIYNEDLGYLFHEGRTLPTAVIGRARQQPYDPFRDPGRAAAEEFGETVVGGLHHLVSQGYAPTDANADYWRAALDKRDHHLTEVSDRVRASPIDETRKRAIVAALSRAREVLALVTPTLCVAYVSAWLRDQVTWRHHLQAIQKTTLADAIRHIECTVQSAPGMGLTSIRES